jgi:hypothetical protein
MHRDGMLSRRSISDRPFAAEMQAHSCTLKLVTPSAEI